MNHVLAKIKRLRKKPFVKLLSNKKLYEFIDIVTVSCVTYDPDHNLDEDSWFKIEQFSEQSYCLEILKKDFDSKNFNQIEKKEFADIDFLLSFQDGDFYFQKVLPSSFLKKRIMAFGEIVSIESIDSKIQRIVINDLPDAIYFQSKDILIFREFTRITGIFKGIDQLYREATDEQTREFLGSDFIALSGDFDFAKVSKPNRKRIALTLAKLGGDLKSIDDSFLNYINDYSKNKITFDNENKKFNISNDDELKHLLYGIDERFYTTPRTQEKRVANSIQRLITK